MTKRVRMQAELVDERPDGLLNDMPAGSTHWRCVLSYGRRKMTVYFSMGPAHCREPKVEEVLSCLVSDAQSIEYADCFETWAKELGYDEDSRKAEKNYRACEKQGERLRVLLGDDFEEIAAEVADV